MFAIRVETVKNKRRKYGLHVYSRFNDNGDNEYGRESDSLRLLRSSVSNPGIESVSKL